MPGCDTCSDVNTCTACSSNYHLVSGACVVNANVNVNEKKKTSYGKVVAATVGTVGGVTLTLVLAYVFKTLYLKQKLKAKLSNNKVAHIPQEQVATPLEQVATPLEQVAIPLEAVANP